MFLSCRISMALVCLMSLSLAGCAGFQGRYNYRVRDAHGGAAWDRKETVQFDLLLSLDGQTVLDATYVMTPDMSRIKMLEKDGTSIVWDGQRAWIEPGDADFPGARFHLMRWPLLLSIPFRLGEPGFLLEPLDTEPGGAHAIRRETPRLTFTAPVVDSPEDWYILYSEIESGRIVAMKYIVTDEMSVAEAEQQPQLVGFRDFRDAQGVMLPRHWKLLAMDQEGELAEGPEVEAKISRVRFPELKDVNFEVPEGAQELPKPKMTREAFI